MNEERTKSLLRMKILKRRSVGRGLQINYPVSTTQRAEGKSVGTCEWEIWKTASSIERVVLGGMRKHHQRKYVEQIQLLLEPTTNF